MKKNLSLETPIIVILLVHVLKILSVYVKCFNITKLHYIHYLNKTNLSLAFFLSNFLDFFSMGSIWNKDFKRNLM